MERKANELLHEIQAAAQCAYLSDLHASPFDERTKVLISEIPDTSYSVAAWNEAASYITGAVCQCQTIREVKEILHRK